MADPLELQLRQAHRAASAGRLQESHSLCADILARDPGCADAWHMMGDLAWTVGDMGRAAAFFRRAHEADPRRPQTLSRLSAALAALGDLGGARQAVEAAMRLKPRDAVVLETLGVTLTKTGDFDRSAPLLEAAVALAPGRIGPLMNLALARQYIGDFAGAADACRQILVMEPRHEAALLALVESGRQTTEMNQIELLQALFDEAGGHPTRTLVIGHALAKSFEDLSDYPKALDWLIRAKAARRLSAPYDFAPDLALFDAAANSNGPRARGASDAAPIFVVGMPRTGTTLVDRILSSHPEVGSVGELQSFPQLVRQAGGGSDAEAVRAIGPDALTGLGRAYLQASCAAGPDRPRLLDKLPFNVFYAGLIHRTLPNARILCLRRDPMDTCLANYRQLFSDESAYHHYAHDLEDVARYYLSFDRLVAHWRKTLPSDRFMEVSYEALVRDQEMQTRRLLEFCDLSWDPRCLAFHENSAGTATASVFQVRQPLYAGAIGRWRRYGAGVAPAETVLKGAGLI